LRRRAIAPVPRLAAVRAATYLLPMRADDLLTVTDRGLYCAAGDFHVDPWRPVDRAVITHGHSDHARPGHQHYLASPAAAPAIRHRLGVAVETLAFGAPRGIGPVTLSLHPAGHLPGSAQVRIEHRGEVWVVSGDYKVARDRLSEPFEPVACHTFITECTFGLPVFRWRTEAESMAEVNAWWAANRAAGRFSLLGAYTLGKAQRLLAGIEAGQGPILTHGAVENINEVLRAQGLRLPATIRVTPDLDLTAHAGALVVAPPSALGSPWARRFGQASDAFASGWMALRGVRRRRAADRGFVISDHADWPGLEAAIRATGATRVIATHGYTAAFSRWLESQGWEAGVVATEFTGESLDTAEAEDAPAPDPAP
jgi:putative mRNA 3-end processing factor